MPKKDSTFFGSRYLKKIQEWGRGKTHLEIHARKDFGSPSLHYINRTSSLELPIEFNSITREPKQVKLFAKPWAKRQQENVQKSDAKLQPPPPRQPRTKPALEPNPFIVPSNHPASDLDEQSPEFRIAYVQYCNQILDKVPILDKRIYWTAHKEWFRITSGRSK